MPPFVHFFNVQQPAFTIERSLLLFLFAPVLVLQLLFGLAGCQNSTQTLAAQFGVMLATEKVVKDHPERAAKAVAIAEEVAKLAAGDTASTVSMLIGVVRARIDWTKLTPTEATAVNLLLAAIETELNNRVNTGQVPADLVYKVGVVASWVKLAAQPYAPAPV